MARTKQAARKGRGGRPPAYPRAPTTIRPSYRERDPELMATVKEAERREEILANRRRVDAKWRPKIPEVRKVNFENFKNRYQDADTPDYAIEVLMAGPGLPGQIRREQAYRRREELARDRQSYMRWLNDDTTPSRWSQPKKSLASDAAQARREKRGDGAIVSASDTEIHRVRIQSQPVLGHLTHLLNTSEQRSTPRTFMRPFKALVHFQPKMREILATLEEKWGDYEELDADEAESIVESEVEVIEKAPSTEGEGESSASANDDTESLHSVDSNAEEDFDSLMDSPEALRDMRCYVNFVDNDIMPLHQRFDGSGADKVKFDDLWSLFRIGDLIYMPSTTESGGRYHEVWRIYNVKVPEPKTAYPSAGWDLFADDPFDDDQTIQFKISAYYIDNDGNGFGAVRRDFTIDAFAGETSIESLEVFPMRYLSTHAALLESLKAQGHRFSKFLEDRHQQYSAWTLTRNPPSDRYCEPDEEILQSEDYNKMRHPEFVESDVIVDLTEAYQRMPDWRPSFHTPSVNRSISCYVEDDTMLVQQWFDGALRQNLSFAQKEIIQKEDGIERRQRRENLVHGDQFLKYRIQGSRAIENNPKALELREEDLVLLPKRLFAYALRERRFFAIDLNLLKPIRREAGVFENLRIQDEYKDVVRGLVMSHFQKKAIERRYADTGTEGPGQDLIQGKGRGLVVLLHGVPGVGKTATAEAVAMENHKPLFVITCGDLGLSPNEVEMSLKNVFRLAHLWDCVLLLDEADVFLSQRSKHDMKRNALVSVFLRVLEYYNGLLFLTTNRVGTIDEAFKSRIHLSLYYPPLDKSQTRDIFRVNISKLKEMEAERHRMTGEPALIIKEAEIIDFASRHYEELARSTGCWNGRQIRSAFQIASSLALHDFTTKAAAARGRGQLPPAAPVLGRSLFEKVQMSTQSFDRHMKKEAGAFDSDLPLRGTFHGSD
ncbi:hypothetical protein F5X68DRAFT_74560 [Plectosphaerella plurivora]|uniref:AAA+ ATPase domain-containing protein n=1 Tax=Plectosphaerella plurivora TaxID=936078 RepID=A0A9P9AEF7_9PEZI|nr:hypothetical protein F5X68DRAFT_74560 [Plectosphaerella plurivora]